MWKRDTTIRRSVEMVGFELKTYQITAVLLSLAMLLLLILTCLENQTIIGQKATILQLKQGCPADTQGRNNSVK